MSFALKFPIKIPSSSTTATDVILCLIFSKSENMLSKKKREMKRGKLGSKSPHLDMI
jgi:hypothetical protein